MCGPFAPTPKLTGKAAKKFIEEMDKASEKNISRERILKAKELYEALFKGKKF